MSEKALVKNASDPQQVQAASKQEGFSVRRDADDFKKLMDQEWGRRIAWKILEKCRMFGSTFSESPSRQGYLSGQQDVGHWLWAELEGAVQGKMFVMMQEAKR